MHGESGPRRMGRRATASSFAPHPHPPPRVLPANPHAAPRERLRRGPIKEARASGPTLHRTGLRQVRSGCRLSPSTTRGRLSRGAEQSILTSVALLHVFDATRQQTLFLGSLRTHAFNVPSATGRRRAYVSPPGRYHWLLKTARPRRPSSLPGCKSTHLGSCDSRVSECARAFRFAHA